MTSDWSCHARRYRPCPEGKLRLAGGNNATSETIANRITVSESFATSERDCVGLRGCGSRCGCTDETTGDIVVES